MLNLSVLDNDVDSVQTLPVFAWHRAPFNVEHCLKGMVYSRLSILNLVCKFDTDYKPKLSRYKVKLVIPAIQATPSYLKWQTWPRSVLPSKKCPVIGGDCKMQIIISLQMINSRPALHWKRVSLGLEISEVLLGQRIRKAELQFKRLLETLSEIWPLT